MAGRVHHQQFSSSLPRLSEEIRLLRAAKNISEFPKQLLRAVEEEIGMYYKNAQACRQRMASLPRTSAGLSAIAELELPLALSERSLVVALRTRSTYFRERLEILKSMALKACGQFEAFDEDLIEKLSDREKFSLKKFCEAEHRRRERLAWRIAAERNGKFSTTADVVFERDCFLEDPWTYVPPGDDDEEGGVGEEGEGAGGEQGGEGNFWGNGDASTSGGERGGRLLRLYTAGRVCRFPLYQAEQLQARRLVRLLRSSSNSDWLPHSKLPL